MGGCSSKPQTAECREVSPLQTALKASDSSAHQTLESLFNQHGRDGEDFLEDAQTLHELLLHAVNSKELPPWQNQSSGGMALTTENAENCTQTKQAGSMSNLSENDQEKGAANLQEPLPGILAAAVATDENCRKVEMTPLDPPKKAAENHIRADGAEKIQEKDGQSKTSVPDFAEMKPEAEECELSKCAEENAIEVESRDLDLEPKSDLQKICLSALPGCTEHETLGLNLGPKSDYLNSSEPYLLQSLPTNDLQKIEAPQSMENQGADPQALEESDMKVAIGRDEMAMETSKMPKPDEKCENNERALQDEGVGEQSGKAMEGEKTETAEEDKKTETQDAKEDLGFDTDRHDGEKAELQHEKAMEAELPKTQVENGWELLEQGKKTAEERTSLEEAMVCEKEDMQAEKAEEATRKAGVQDEESMRADEKTGVQNERDFNGEVEKLQRDEDKEAVSMKDLVDTQGEGEKAGVQNERNLNGEVKKLHKDEDEKTMHREKAVDAQCEEVTPGAGQPCEAEKLDNMKDARATVPEVVAGAAQHCEAKKLDDTKDARATDPEESLIKLATTEKRDDKSASDPLGAKVVCMKLQKRGAGSV